jgi:hypothetical protein
MKFNPKGLIATAAWILVVVTAFKTQTVGVVDNLFTIALGIVLLVSSVALVVARIRGFSALGQFDALREIRRWLPHRWNHL